MDTNVNEEVDMDLLVDDQPNPEEDYKEEVNKDVVDQNPDPDQVVKADLEMDPAAATEKFIRKHFGMSAEELEEEADTVAEAAEEDTTTASDVDPEDALLGIEPAAEETTVVAITPPAGGDTEVITDGGVETPAADVGTDIVTTTEESVAAASEPETAAEVSSVENLRMIFSREDEDTSGDEPDVSLNVETPNNNVDIDLEDKAVTIEPVEEGASDDVSTDTGDTGSTDDVPAPETDDTSTEEPAEGSENTEGGESETDNSAESWWFV